ncbi:NADAR family protein [Wangella sp. NEAU-J3]|nr:NADAR family protein [Jidongwangia harbinensis]MCA2214989.1 NADAR family protein [Jidongwangia harbinensis]
MVDPPRDVNDLRALAAARGRLNYLFFWGHRPPPDRAVGPGCLSQWWPAPFVVDGIRYATAEHCMMAGKARLFGDESIAARIVAADSPNAAKALGREIRAFDEQVWRAHRFDLVVAANLAKFGQHPGLAAYLLGTGNRVLVEASPVDRIWGIGLAAHDARAADPARWPGLNLLGFALMRVRAALTVDGAGVA